MSNSCLNSLRRPKLREKTNTSWLNYYTYNDCYWFIYLLFWESFVQIKSMSNCFLNSLNLFRRPQKTNKYLLCWQLTFTFVFETRLLNWVYFLGSFSFIPRNLSGVRNSGNSHFSNFADDRKSHSNKWNWFWAHFSEQISTPHLGHLKKKWVRTKYNKCLYSATMTK